MQLLHSKYMIDCLTKILDENFEYKQGYLILNKKSLNKGRTRKSLKKKINKY